MKECLSCQNRCPDCASCFRNLHEERDEARENCGVAERANAMHVEALKTCRLERDEARQAAREVRPIVKMEQRWSVELEEAWLKKWPWLKESEK